MNRAEVNDNAGRNVRRCLPADAGNMGELGQLKSLTTVHPHRGKKKLQCSKKTVSGKPDYLIRSNLAYTPPLMEVCDAKIVSVSGHVGVRIGVGGFIDGLGSVSPSEAVRSAKSHCFSGRPSLQRKSAKFLSNDITAHFPRLARLMNLLYDPWMPVRDRAGSRRWITPDRLSDPDLVAFDADRPDFNGALAQFAIGLLQTATPVQNEIAWGKLFRQAPDAATLRQWFEPIAAAFEFDGDGARFMQDADLGDQGIAVNDIASLLIESPGENAAKNNTGHFVKSGRFTAMCPACAAAALLTLQMNAPAGGAGHRTGVRGGGPLTTLLLAQAPGTLWHDLWLNVLEQPVFRLDRDDSDFEAPHSSFPWLAPIGRTQKEGGQLAPAQVHPAHVYWAMPRRIRLDFSQPAEGECGICGRASTGLVRHYATKNYGFNYKGAWNHPLSPYYESKEGWLPVHPQPDGLGWRHWLAWVLGTSDDKKRQRSARVINHAIANRHGQLGGTLRLWAFGYDMDNMKPRCWYESTVPLYGLADCGADAQSQVRTEVARWLAASELAAFYLRSAVKDAWFDADARGDMSAVAASFWGSIESAFYTRLRQLVDSLQGGQPYAEAPARESWLGVIRGKGMALFDGTFVGSGPIERQKPQRAAQAYQRLCRNLYGPKLREALGLQQPESTTKAKKPKKTPPAKAT